MKIIYCTKFVWISSPADFIFWLIIVLVPALNIFGWWRLANADAASMYWRKLFSCAGLLVNAVLILTPFAIAFSPRLQSFDWSSIVVCALSLSAFSFIASIAGLKQVRIPLLISSLAIAIFYLMIPVGI